MWPWALVCSCFAWLQTEGLLGLKCPQLLSLARLQLALSLRMQMQQCLVLWATGDVLRWFLLPGTLQQLWSKTIIAVIGQLDVNGKGVISQQPLFIPSVDLHTAKTGPEAGPH